MTTERLLLRPAEAANLLSVGRTKIYQLLADEELPSVRLGGSIRVPLGALERWVEDQGRTDADRESADGETARSREVEDEAQ